MSKKILFTASTMSHIENFHLPYLEAFKKQGWEVKAIALPVSKRFFSFQNLRAINYTRKILKEEKFDVISSHATLAGIVTRLAVMMTGKDKRRVKVFHTAHGYLFQDDMSLKKWAYLLPEMICAKVTDVLMVMNHEDLDIAKKYKLCKEDNRIYYINGMGIDLSRFQPRRATAEQKNAFGIAENDFVFVYAAEFSRRKNHELLLRGFAKAIEKIKELENNNELGNNHEPPADLSSDRLKLVLAGDGVLLDEMKALAIELGIADRVIFLGYTRNVDELYPCCDVSITTSRSEGLPFNVMEAMACGLPVIVSDIKGHKELVGHGENGLLFESENMDELADQMVKIYLDAEFREKCRSISLEKIKIFSTDNVFPGIMNIYENNM
ncbi:MAG TPA: glycosyltransferase family 4 protein [Anaerovoracaceae bacterium]|nr:glycosyltransferase family 4 protein [Anaerovoracaceae bacterium]